MQLIDDKGRLLGLINIVDLALTIGGGSGGSGGLKSRLAKP